MEKRTVVLVKGVSGIGWEITENSLCDEYDLIAVAIQNQRHQSYENYVNDLELSHISNSSSFIEVSNLNACIAAIRKVTNCYEYVNFLINDKSVIRKSIFRKMTCNHRDKVIYTDLNALFKISQSFFDHNFQRNKSCVINISSVTARKKQLCQAKCGLHNKSDINRLSKSMLVGSVRHGGNIDTVA